MDADRCGARGLPVTADRDANGAADDNAIHHTKRITDQNSHTVADLDANSDGHTDAHLYTIAYFYADAYAAAYPSRATRL